MRNKGDLHHFYVFVARLSLMATLFFAKGGDIVIRKDHHNIRTRFPVVAQLSPELLMISAGTFS